MKLKGNRIIVKQADASDKTAGGIYIPDSHVKQPNIGTITHVGDEVVDQELLGKDVMFQVEASQPFEYGEIKGRLLFPTDIIATLN